jgi:polyhydroxybutyrate depolymerase
MKTRLLTLGALALLPLLASIAAEPVRREWTVDGVTREALVSAPEAGATNPAPVVFVFHGHGGSMRNTARSFAIHTLWPEAIVVYPQGLNTPGRLTDPEGKRPGWQSGAGAQDDRDLKFFDAMRATLRKEHRVDERRIYATGHSNGGGFTYLLWAERGDVFAAMAPSGAAAAASRDRLKPKPMLHVAGENDPLVKFAWQRLTIDYVRKLNGCGEAVASGEYLTTYPSTNGAPVVTYLHPGGHEFPRAAPALMVQFFRAHTKP